MRLQSPGGIFSVTLMAGSRTLLLLLAFVAAAWPSPAGAQCCAGGSASPIAGGTSQGVLGSRELEVSTYFQFARTEKFYMGSKPDTGRTFDRFESKYQYLRLAYGLSSKFTMSVEAGYYLGKKQTGLNGNPETTYESSGLADIILFPRYALFNTSGTHHRTGATAGLGFKIPAGSHNDSAGFIEPFSGDTYYITKPQSVQLASGAQDIIFYAMLHREFLPSGIKVFMNGLYIRKGWNDNGEKLGDYAGVGLFASKSFFSRLGVTLQLRYEHVDSMRINEAVLLFGRPSTYFPGATGYKKLFLVPQVSYSRGPLTAFVSTDIPLHQNVNSSPYYSQAASQHLFTVGVAYRFIVPGARPDATAAYACPMHPEVTSAVPATCRICGMDLEIVKGH